jgi:hypothetical protein
MDPSIGHDPIRPDRLRRLFIIGNCGQMSLPQSSLPVFRTRRTMSYCRGLASSKSHKTIREQEREITFLASSGFAPAEHRSPGSYKVMKIPFQAADGGLERG